MYFCTALQLDVLNASWNISNWQTTCPHNFFLSQMSDERLAQTLIVLYMPDVRLPEEMVVSFLCFFFCTIQIVMYIEHINCEKFYRSFAHMLWREFFINVEIFRDWTGESTIDSSWVRATSTTSKGKLNERVKMTAPEKCTGLRSSDIANDFLAFRKLINGSDPLVIIYILQQQQ